MFGLLNTPRPLSGSTTDCTWIRPPPGPETDVTAPALTLVAIVAFWAFCSTLASSPRPLLLLLVSPALLLVEAVDVEAMGSKKEKNKIPINK